MNHGRNVAEHHVVQRVHASGSIPALQNVVAPARTHVTPTRVSRLRRERQRGIGMAIVT